MYNRYIPQADGSYRRSRIPENDVTTEAPPPHPDSTEKIDQVEAPITNNPPPKQSQHQHGYSGAQRYTHSATRDRPRNTDSGNVGNFLRQLLPQNFDTEDLIIVLLLLLISSENKDDQNSALLTLVIYLFL